MFLNLDSESGKDAGVFVLGLLLFSPLLFACRLCRCLGSRCF